MPKDTSGTVPPTKSQRNKAARIARLAKQGGKTFGGKCTRCYQESASATPGKPHLGCSDKKSMFEFDMLYRCQAPFLRKYAGPNGEGVWLHSEDFIKYENEVNAYLVAVRNFNTAKNRWENGYNEPIDFLTGTVLQDTQRHEITVEQEVAVEQHAEPTVEAA